jgi:hypothetical protein
VDVIYANSSLTCLQLRAAWLITLTKAKWHPTDDGSSATRIQLDDSRATIISTWLAAPRLAVFGHGSPASVRNFPRVRTRTIYRVSTGGASGAVRLRYGGGVSPYRVRALFLGARRNLGVFLERLDLMVRLLRHAAREHLLSVVAMG